MIIDNSIARDFTIVPNWLLEEEFSKQEFKVIQFLLKQKGVVEMTNSAIMAAVGITRKPTLSAVWTSLSKRGLIEKKGPDGKPHTIRILTKKTSENDVFVTGQNDEISTSEPLTKSVMGTDQTHNKNCNPLHFLLPVKDLTIKNFGNPLISSLTSSLTSSNTCNDKLLNTSNKLNKKNNAPARAHARAREEGDFNSPLNPKIVTHELEATCVEQTNPTPPIAPPPPAPTHITKNRNMKKQTLKSSDDFFERFVGLRKIYKGNKAATSFEFEKFKASCKKYKTDPLVALDLIERYIADRIAYEATESGFKPNWPNFQTFLNQGRYLENPYRKEEAQPTDEYGFYKCASQSERLELYRKLREENVIPDADSKAFYKKYVLGSD